MRKLIATAFIVISSVAYSQSKRADSLKQVINADKQDSGQVKALVALARIYLYSKPDTGLSLAISGLSLSKQISFTRGEASCLESIADASDNLGNYPVALENYFNALRIYEQLKEENGIRRTTGAIGTIYSEQGEYHHALEYSFKAKEMAEKVKNKRAMSVQLLNIGDDYNKLRMFDSARIYTLQSYRLAVEASDADMTGVALNNLGEIFSAMAQDELALQYYRQSLPFSKAAEDDDIQCDAWLGMAKIFRKKNQPDSGVYYARLSFDLAKNDGFTKRIYDASVFLTDYYKVAQKIDSAFSYQQITMDTKDSLFSEEKVRQIQNLSFQEKLRQEQIAEEKQRAEEERKNNLQLIGITVFIVTFILFFLLIIRRKTKPRTIEFFGVLALLLVFEFIALFIHPYLEKWTHHTPVYMLLMLVGIASLLVPLHHRMERVVKEKLAHKIHHVSKPAPQPAHQKAQAPNRTKK
jgi:tetratricopeptide (TPR) repeat protein